MVADVTFWGRMYGFIVFRAPSLKKNLYYKLIPYETIYEYALGRTVLEQKGFRIAAIVLDGRPGVRNIFSDIPVQMCHFHQMQIMTRYLTTRPKLIAGQILRHIALCIPKSNEAEMKEVLDTWHEEWKDFLKEKTYNPETKRWFYTHKRLRSTYRSITRNLLLLYTYQKYP